MTFSTSSKLAGRLLSFAALATVFLGPVLAQTEGGGPREIGTRAEYDCNDDECRLPDCHCASVTSPLGADTPREQIPHITFTADDAIQTYTVDTVNRFLGHRRNPNSCPVGMTYFVSLNYTDYHLVTNMYVNSSYEIADHTMTHVFPTQDEVNGNLRALNAFAGIPMSEIQGFRAPFLNFTGEALELLGRSEFRYDSSASTNTRANATDSDAYWPYTLDHGLANSCDLVTDACDGQIEVPGMWEIPMYTIFESEDSTTAHLMDPYLDGDSDNSTDFVSWLRYTFESHYNGNRQPFGIYTHPIHLAENYPGVASPTELVEGLNEFLDWATSFDNVWIITNQQLLDWMIDPVPADELNDFAPFHCQVPDVDDGICNGLNDEQENVLLQCPFSEFPWRTCYGCPEENPTPANPVPAQDTDIGVRYHLPGNCSTAFFDPVENRCLCDGGSCAFVDHSKPVGPNGEPIEPGQTGSGDSETATASFAPFGAAPPSLDINPMAITLAGGLLTAGFLLGGQRLLF